MKKKIKEKIEIEEIGKDFAFLKKELQAVILFGSKADRTAHERSDTDICLVAKENIRPSEILGNAWRKGLAAKYDIHVFQELPLYIQIDIIENGKTAWAENAVDLSYFFYFYRKLWNDQKHRNLEAIKIASKA